MAKRTKKHIPWSATKKHIPCECRECRELEALRQKAIEADEAGRERRAAEELAGPPDLVTYTDVCIAAEKLRLWHHQLVETVAVKLRPRFEAGELYGFRDCVPGKEEDYKGARALLKECADRIGNQADAFLTLAVSPSTDAIDVEDFHIVETAVEAFAADVLRVARLRRFYEMKPGEALNVWG